jgi:flagellar assembly protein FliH
LDLRGQLIMTNHFLDLRDIDAEIALERKRAISGEDRTFSKAEHDELVTKAAESARNTGYEEGYKAGREAERADVLSEIKVVMESLTPKMEGFLAGISDHQARLEDQVLDFVMSACIKVLPEAVDTWGRDRVMQEIESTISRCIDKPSLKITASERAAYELRNQLDELAAEKGFKGDISVLGGPDLTRGEVRIEWDNGFMEYRMPEVCDEIIAALKAAHNQQKTTK